MKFHTKKLTNLHKHNTYLYLFENPLSGVRFHCCEIFDFITLSAVYNSRTMQILRTFDSWDIPFLKQKKFLMGWQYKKHCMKFLTVRN